MRRHLLDRAVPYRRWHLAPLMAKWMRSSRPRSAELRDSVPARCRSC